MSLFIRYLYITDIITIVCLSFYFVQFCQSSTLVIANIQCEVWISYVTLFSPFYKGFSS